MSIEAMRQALEALADPWKSGPDGVASAITALRAAIEQAEKQEPVAWQGVHDQTDLYYRKPPQADVRPLYTNPPAEPRQWVGLTGDEVNEFSAGCHLGNSVQGAIRAAEARLKGKNHG